MSRRCTELSAASYAGVLPRTDLTMCPTHAAPYDEPRMPSISLHNSAFARRLTVDNG